MTIDLFNQVIYRQDGYVAIVDYESDWPIPPVDVFNPAGEWCGCTNSTNEAIRMAAIRQIIKYNQDYEGRKQQSNDAPRSLRGLGAGEREAVGEVSPGKQGSDAG